MNVNTDYRVRTAIEKLVKIVEDAEHYKATPSSQSIRQGLDDFAEAIVDVAVAETIKKLHGKPAASG